MSNTNKLATTVSMLTVVALFLGACSKTSESGSKYPRDFPQECITAFDNHALFITKVRNSGRFDEESINEREKRSLALLENFKNPPRQRAPSKEEYISACKSMENLTQSRLRGMENMDKLSDEELEQAVGLFMKNSPRR